MIVKNLAVMLEQLGNEGYLVIKPLLYQIVPIYLSTDKRSWFHHQDIIG